MSLHILEIFVSREILFQVKYFFVKEIHFYPRKLFFFQMMCPIQTQSLHLYTSKGCPAILTSSPINPRWSNLTIKDPEWYFTSTCAIRSKQRWRYIPPWHHKRPDSNIGVNADEPSWKCSSLDNDLRISVVACRALAIICSICILPSGPSNEAVAILCHQMCPDRQHRWEHSSLCNEFFSNLFCPLQQSISYYFTICTLPFIFKWTI